MTQSGHRQLSIDAMQLMSEAHFAERKTLL
jgi:hypothetical protein